MGFASSNILTLAHLTKRRQNVTVVGELAELLRIQIARYRNDFSDQRGGRRGRHRPSEFAPPAAITHRRPCPGRRAN